MPADIVNAPALDRNRGWVVAVHGSVLDIRFDASDLPAIEEAVSVDWDRGPALLAEVQQHVDLTTVRAVALAETAGLRQIGRAHV